MGITEAQWESSPEGLTAGGMGLSLTPRSTIKIAGLLLNNGIYQGKRLLSKLYLSKALSPQIAKPDNDSQHYKGKSYGYQFHISGNGHCYLDGAFGQLILLHPDKNLAFIAFSQNSKTEELLAEIYRHFIELGDNLRSILSAVSDDAPEPKKQDLAVSHSKLFVPISFPDHSFTLKNNPLHISSIKLGTNEMVLTHMDGQENVICFDFKKDTHGRAWFIKDLQTHEQDYVSEVVSALQNRLVLRVYWIETPYVTTWEFDFSDDGLSFRFDINVSFTLQAFEVKGSKSGESCAPHLFEGGIFRKQN